MSSDDDESPVDLDIHVIAREEAHRTIDNQIQTLNDIDAKAARILRINLVLIGILLTGLSIAAPPAGTGDAPVTYTDLANIYNFAGIVLLLLSTGFAAVTYTASSLRAGMGRGDIQDMIDNDYSDRQNVAGLVDSYAEWIEFNYRINQKNAALGTITLLLLLFGITSVALGVKLAVTGQVEWWLLIGVVILLLSLTYLTNIVPQLRRWGLVRG